MLVIDSSAVIEALTGKPLDRALLQRLGDDGDLHAPHLVDVEVISALRRLVRSGAMTAARATDALLDYGDLPITRYPHLPLAERIWSLRDNLSAYDAAFIALSEALKSPLITCDARLAAASGGRARVELFGARESRPRRRKRR